MIPENEKTPYELLLEYERGQRAKRRAKFPIQRSWIKPKRRQKKTLWRTGQVKLDSKGMATLRSDRYAMSEGICECGKIPANRKRCCGTKGCGKQVSYAFGELHHLLSRAHGGSDTIKNTRFITRECHDIITGKVEWSRPLLPEFAEIFHYKKPPEKVSSEPAREQGQA